MAMSEAAKASVEDLYKQAAAARDAAEQRAWRLENENEVLREALDRMAMLVVRYERLHTLMASLEPNTDPRDVYAASVLAAEESEAMYENEVASAAYERAKKATKPEAAGVGRE